MELAKKDKNKARLITICQGLGFFVAQDLARELDAYLSPFLNVPTMLTFNAELDFAPEK